MKVKFRPKFKVLMHETNVVADITQDQYFDYYSNLDKYFAELVETYKAQGKELTGGMFMFEGDNTKWLVGSCAGSKGYSNSKDWIKPTTVISDDISNDSEHDSENMLTVKDLYKVLSPFQDIQFFDSRTGNPLTGVSYIADSGCEIENYECDKIYGIAPKVDSDNKPYLAIMVELAV